MDIHVLWQKPVQPLPSGAVAISFLFPSDEHALVTAWGGELLYGRELVRESAAAARRIYCQLVAQVGVAKLDSGETLRNSMRQGDEASHWWFHGVAARDSEGAPQFGWILHVLAVQQAVKETGADGLVLHGPPAGLAALLARTVKTTIVGEAVSKSGRLVTAGRGIAARLRFFSEAVQHWFVLRRHYRLPTTQFEIALSSFWDWGVSLGESPSDFVDRYFKRIPALLRGRGRYGYFAWFDPHAEPRQRGRSWREVLLPAIGRDDVVLLQAYLSFGDIARAVLNFRALWSIYLLFSSNKAAEIFVVEGTDWRPLLEQELWRGAANANIPKCRLVALATKRAAKAHRPRVTLTFLEHFLHARAHYDGIRQSKVGALNCTMQHAGCARDKTFYYLHPDIEFAGQPDGCAVPHPDRVFVMGSLGRQVFLECGYKHAQVVMSGSARYDHILATAPALLIAPSAQGTLNVLIACSLETSTEVALAEAAGLAARGLPGLKLRMRNHPVRRVDEDPRFWPFRSEIEVSSGSLNADLTWAHVVLYSYSTVAEEAFLHGKSAWQWLPTGFNGSALVEAVDVPQIASVAALRDRFERASVNGVGQRPSAGDRRQAVEYLFHPADGRAAERICADLLAAAKSGTKGASGRGAALSVLA